MNPLTSWHLKRFCEEHQIDVHEIDNSLTYGENKEHLEQFTMRTLEDLAKEYGRTSDIVETQAIYKKPKKKWVYREPKVKWITISKTHIEISSH